MEAGSGDAVDRRMAVLLDRIREAQAAGLYFYHLPISETSGPWVTVGGRRMLMMASYSYLGLNGHPDISRAAQAALDRFGTGTHGVRPLAGTLTLHRELEETIAGFADAEDAIVYSSGYVTNLSVISTLVARGDVVIGDKVNHASIVDGCRLSQARFIRFRHNDMADLERALSGSGSAARLVVVDAVFSMDGDVIDLPEVSRLCRRHGARLMVDEAHSLGVLGRTGRGIEEHFGLPPGTIDIKMGTLSKTIPSLGGYVAGRRDVIEFLRNASRAYLFSAALPPASVAAARAAFQVIEREPWRVDRVQRLGRRLLDGLRGLGFDTLRSETAIVPIVAGEDECAFRLARGCHERDVFAIPIISPAVPLGLARLRVTVTAAHEEAHVERALAVIEQAGRAAGIPCGG